MSDYAPHPLDVAEMQAEHEGIDLEHNPMFERLLTVSDLRQLTPTTPLVDGLLYRDTLAQLSGGPGSYKTFLTLGMALSLAVGQPWEGHAVPEARNVVYVAAEGATGVQARILAWCELNRVDPDQLNGRFYVLPDSFQLGEQVDVGLMIDLVKTVDAGLLVIDTRARCTVGLEENSATEQGKAIRAAEMIQSANGCTVLAVHHSSRGGGAGRGSNAWDGAVWTDLRVEGEELAATITCHKHKDVPAGCKHEFRMHRHTVSEELMPGVPEGQRQTLVGFQDAVGIQGPDSNSRWNRILEYVWNVAPPEGLTVSKIASGTNVPQSSVYYAVKMLVERGALRVHPRGGYSTYTASRGAL